MSAEPAPKRRGRQPLPPDQRKPRRPRGDYARPVQAPTPEQASEARALIEAWAVAMGWPAREDGAELVPGWRPRLARRLGVCAHRVGEVHCGRLLMPAVWRERMAGGGSAPSADRG